ncbi:MAG: fused MFS/spermidine synthase [Deltaproteobacteria bacterium]|nr:fused MFS/spermidine synthase [Deltaproteobacteria bacterium]
MIVKIIGGAPFAVSIILTVFMGGLGLGSYLASRTIDRVKEPLKLIKIYGILELMIGAYGLILPLLLILYRPLYEWIYNHLFSYFLGYNLITFVGCSLLLIIPVTCMGATLPVLSRFFITTISHVGTHVGRLYGLNTIGAAAGSLLCGFWLIINLGVWGSLIFAVILNSVIGLFCVYLSYHLTRKGIAPEIMTEAATRTREKAIPEVAVPENTSAYRLYALTIFGVSGFCAMAYEVIWTKLLGLIVGPTTYSFTIVLVTFITGLALGSLFFGWLGDRTKNVIGLLLITQITAALFALLLSQVMGNSQIFFAKLIYHFKDHFAWLSLVKAIFMFTFMFFPTFCLGATFPLVGKIYTRSLSQTGRSIGFAYAINSVGAVLGAFCAGFLLIPLLGKEQSLSLIVALQLLMTLFIGLHRHWKTGERVSRWIPLVLPAMLGLVLVFFYPHWDRKMLARGIYHRFNQARIENMSWFETLFPSREQLADFRSGEVLYFGDGIGGFTTVIKHKMDILGNENIVLYNSGKPDASSKLDMDTQTLLAHFPLLFHPNPEQVLVIGLASGITAGEVLYYPVERLDLIDINRQVVAASNFFIPWNNNVLSHPKTKLIIQDARAHLALSDSMYDVISSEPSNPWMAGLASLFTKEFFALARNRLNDDGIFVQMFHAYQMDWETFALVGRTFSTIFPNSLLVRTNPTSIGPDFLLIGFKGERGLDEDIAAQNLRHAKRSSNTTLLNHRLFYSLIMSEDLKRLFGDGPVNTDNRPWLEFSAPKLMHTFDLTIPKRIISNSWISKKTIGIIEESIRDVDFQIDFAAYALPLIETKKAFENPVDLSRASPYQKERFSKIMDEYCANRPLEDFSFLEDDALRKQCVSVQIDTVRKRLRAGVNKALLYFHLGNLHYESGMWNESIKYYSKGLRMDPSNEAAHYKTGNALVRQGRIAQAINHYSEVLNLNPNHIDVLNNLAWIFATHRDPTFRNGPKAVQMAERASELGGHKRPDLLDTLAAAYAEAGRFEKARLTAQKAIKLSRATGHEKWVTDIEKRLQLYQSNRPFHEGLSFTTP